MEELVWHLSMHGSGLITYTKRVPENGYPCRMPEKWKRTIQQTEIVNVGMIMVTQASNRTGHAGHNSMVSNTSRSHACPTMENDNARLNKNPEGGEAAMPSMTTILQSASVAACHGLHVIVQI